MWILGILPFIFQGIVLFFDEGYFHIKRGLPKWERIGHPIDTLSVILCMGFVLFVPFSTQNLIFYILLAAGSCILVTKDEFVHKEHCPASEQWLHALLFTIHPITLIAAGFIWPVVQGAEVTPWIARWLDQPQFLRLFLKTQFAIMVLFCIYQVVYWNFIWKEKPATE